MAYENAIGNKDGAIESGDDEEGKKKFALWMKCFKEDREGQLEFLRGQVKKTSDLTPEEADLVPFNAIVEICEKGFEACILEVKRIQREINGLTSESQLFHRHKTFMEDLEDRIDLQEMYLSISEVKREERDVEKKIKDEEEVENYKQEKEKTDEKVREFENKAAERRLEVLAQAEPPPPVPEGEAETEEGKEGEGKEAKAGTEEGKEGAEGKEAKAEAEEGKEGEGKEEQGNQEGGKDEAKSEDKKVKTSFEELLQKSSSEMDQVGKHTAEDAAGPHDRKAARKPRRVQHPGGQIGGRFNSSDATGAPGSPAEGAAARARPIARRIPQRGGYSQ